jgi:hypothetical protein
MPPKTMAEAGVPKGLTDNKYALAGGKGEEAGLFDEAKAADGSEVLKSGRGFQNVQRATSEDVFARTLKKIGERGARGNFPCGA